MTDATIETLLYDSQPASLLLHTVIETVVLRHLEVIENALLL